MDDAEKVLQKDYSVHINGKEVYAVGLSAGGAMACILGVTYPDRFSGIARYVRGYPMMQSILIYGQKHGPEQQTTFW